METEAGSADLPLLVEGLIALGIGLFIGLEREHRHVDEGRPERTVNGVRTFALLALAGWMASVLEDRWAWLPPVLLGLVGVMIVVQYVRETREPGRLGVTTEIAALLTVVYGMLAHGQPQLAVPLALVTTLVLISKPWVREVMPRLQRNELLAALQFLIVVAVVLPLLPTEPADPWGVLPPRKIGIFVLLVACVGFVGYVLTRLFGRAKAAGLTGIVGGLASSTAVTANMAQQVRRAPAQIAACELGVLAANAVMPLRLLVVVLLVNRATALELAPPMGVLAAVLGLAAWRAARAAKPGRKSDGDDEGLSVKNPFALLPALKWGAFLCVVLLVAHFARERLGDTGLLATAALAGLADVDAISLVCAKDAATGSLSTDTAALAITIAVMANGITKAVIAWVSGGPAFGRRIGLALGAGMAAALIAALVT